jgi:hypothetical protein
MISMDPKSLCLGNNDLYSGWKRIQEYIKVVVANEASSRNEEN